MPDGCDDFRRSDPLPLKKVVRISDQVNAVSKLALESGAELPPRNTLEESPQLAALAKEYGSDAVRLALDDLKRIGTRRP